MSVPPLSDIDFKNNMAWAWTTLKMVHLKTSESFLSGSKKVLFYIADLPKLLKVDTLGSDIVESKRVIRSKFITMQKLECKHLFRTNLRLNPKIRFLVRYISQNIPLTITPVKSTELFQNWMQEMAFNPVAIC